MKKRTADKKTKKEAHMDPDPAQSAQTSLRGNPNSPMSPTVTLEPTTVTVPEHTPWYKRLFGSGTHTQTVWKLSFLMMFLIAVLVSIKIQQPQTLETKAGVHRARISLLPTSVSLPPDAFVQLWVTTDATLTSGQFEVSFDPAILSIVEAKPPNSTPLTNAVKITPLKQVNMTGKIFIVLSPTADNVTPAAGTFELINITFHAKSPAVKASTEVNLVADGTKLYHEKTPFVITGASKSTLMIGTGQ